MSTIDSAVDEAVRRIKSSRKPLVRWFGIPRTDDRLRKVYERALENPATVAAGSLSDWSESADNIVDDIRGAVEQFKKEHPAPPDFRALYNARFVLRYKLITERQGNGRQGLEWLASQLNPKGAKWDM